MNRFTTPFRKRPDASDTTAFAGGLAIVVALFAADLALGTTHGLTATVVLGPIVAGLRGSVRQTAIVSAAAILAALGMGFANSDAGDLDQLIRDAVVALGSVLAAVGAGARANAVTSLAMANAGLSSDLAVAERQFGIAFDSLAAAVMIQRPGQGIVYANQATAVAMGMATPADVIAATPEQIAEGFDTFDENGVPLLADRYPSGRILRGETMSPEPLVVRTINRETGREYWRVVKASPVLTDDGQVVMTVSITEDITEIKRAEESQRQIAATLQSSLLPAELPDLDGFRVATMYRPAGRDTWVGGDFYDAFVVDDGWMLFVGDVTGSGAEAAAMTAQARFTLRAVGEQTGDHLAAVARLNHMLVASSELALCTVCIVRFAPGENGSVMGSVACAGHPLPYLVRGGEVRDVGQAGPLVGAWDAPFTATGFEMEPGDLLVLYTDGVIEARGQDDRFGEARFCEQLAVATDAEDVIVRVGLALDDFQSGRQADDTAIVVVEYLGGSD